MWQTPATLLFTQTLVGAEQLRTARYPDGSSEQEQYNALGNRITLTSTSLLSGTGVTTNQYDNAGELTTSTDTLAEQTSYSYDGNGNQAGSRGPLGTRASICRAKAVSRLINRQTRRSYSLYTDFRCAPSLLHSCQVSKREDQRRV